MVGWPPQPSTALSGMSSGEPSATSFWTAWLFSRPIEGARRCGLVHNEGMKVDVECYAGRKADDLFDSAIQPRRQAVFR